VYVPRGETWAGGRGGPSMVTDVIEFNDANEHENDLARMLGHACDGAAASTVAGEG